MKLTLKSRESKRVQEVVSQVGFVESATPVANQPEKFRPKRAAVLICLFEGDHGDLRVILTKRSSKLSTHSGDDNQFLVSLAISCGFRESGITGVNKRVIIAIRCSIRLEVPLGDTQKIMVSPEYVKYLVGVANEKMEANRRRTDNFLEALLKIGFTGPGTNVERTEKNLVNGQVDYKDSLVCPESEKSESLHNDDDRDVERRYAQATHCGN